MAVKISKNQIKNYKFLFKNFKALNQVLMGYLENNIGFAYVDDLDNPTIIFYSAFDKAWFIKGDITFKKFLMMTKNIELPALFFIDDFTAVHPISQVYKYIMVRERTCFSSKELSRDHIQRLITELPDGFSLKFIDIQTGMEINSPCYPEENKEKYVREGLGYCIMHNEEICGYAVSTKSFSYEIDVFVHENYRKKGFATILCAKLIDHCLRENIRPHWDADNPPSAKLATKLGFSYPFTYNTYLALPTELSQVHKLNWSFNRILLANDILSAIEIDKLENQAELKKIKEFLEEFIKKNSELRMN